ncbi:MAG TPA: histidine phosphatase family protein [Pyrinomonadaceae bacterium]
MKKLLLLRHAKSSWEDASLPDFERPLNERGLRAAPLVGKFLRQQKIRPDLVICSPAKRTRETIALVLKAAGIETEVRYDERIYEASVSRLREVISEIEDDKREVMLVGHNPGFENLLERLTGQQERMPTAALARIILDSENWKEAAAKSGYLELFVKAKELARR